MEETVKYGINLSGVTRIFSKTKDIKAGKKTYSITDFWCNVSEKQEDGTYEQKSIKLMFPRKMAEHAQLPKSNQTIKFNAFPVLTGEGKYVQIAWMVVEWEYTEAGLPKAAVVDEDGVVYSDGVIAAQ